MPLMVSVSQGLKKEQATRDTFFVEIVRGIMDADVFVIPLCSIQLK